MAPTITFSSNSLMLLTTTTTTHSRLAPRLTTVLAKKEGADAPNSTPFRFNFGKLSDFKSLIPVVSSSSSSSPQRRKDPGTVFVAGATGLTGIRIAQTLLRQGFTVRAGVPDLDAAQDLALLASNYKIISNQESKRLNAVESTFQDAELIAKAIGNASKVVVTIGRAEYGPDKEVTASDALLVVQAAQLAGVDHVAIVYDGNAGLASTYNVLDGISMFFNNLLSQSQLTVAELLGEIVKTNVNYTLIKTSLTEDFSPERSYNVVVSAEGSAGENDYKVAKSQIAYLVADVFSNTQVAENKVVEVFTNPSAPLMSVDELFSAIPEDGRRKAYAESTAKAKAEEEAKEAAEAVKKLSRASSVTEEDSIESLVEKLKEIGSRFSLDKISAAAATALQESAELEKTVTGEDSIESLMDKANKIVSRFETAVQESGEIPKVQLATVRGQVKARTLPSQKAVSKQSARKPPMKPKKEEKPKTEVKNVFGGLFKQETIYVDDD